MTGYSHDRTGFAVGIDFTTGIGKAAVSGDNTYNADKVTFSNNVLYGFSFTGEYMGFDGGLGLSFGFGLKYYKLTFTEINNGTTFQHEILSYYLDIPVTLRFRPMAWISPGSRFTFHVGMGLDFQGSAFGKQRIITTTSRTAKKMNPFAGIGFISEAGIGFYVHKLVLLQGYVKYNVGLINVSQNSAFQIKPRMAEFGFAIMYKVR